MKKFNIILMSVLFVMTIVEWVQYFYFWIVPWKSDMFFLYGMTLLAIANYILDGVNNLLTK